MFEEFTSPIDVFYESSGIILYTKKNCALAKFSYGSFWLVENSCNLVLKCKSFKASWKIKFFHAEMPLVVIAKSVINIETNFSTQISFQDDF